MRIQPKHLEAMEEIEEELNHAEYIFALLGDTLEADKDPTLRYQYVLARKALTAARTRIDGIRRKYRQ